VALVPIRLGNRILGLIHVADHQENMVPLEMVKVLEGVAMQLGTAIQRVWAEERLWQAHDELEQRVKERTAELVKVNERLEQEIEERKQTEQVLLETKGLLETAFSSTVHMIAYMDKDFNFLRVNRAYAEADDRDPEFFLGKNHFHLYPNKENEAIFRSVVETGKPYFAFEKPFEYAEHPERGVTYWDWSLQPVKDSGGKVGGVVLSLVNVTGRKRAQEALWESEHRYRNLFEESRDPVYIISREGKFISINQAVSDLFGYPREELMGMHVQELYGHPEDRRRFQEVIKQKGSVRDYEIKLRKKDGTELNCLVTSTVRRGNDGSALGYQGIMRDITERKRAEEEQTRLQRRQEALWRIARLVGVGYRALCDRVLVEIMDMTQSRYAFFGFLNQDENVMSLYSWSREALEDCQIQSKPIDYPISEAGLWGDAVRQRKTLIINDYQADHPNKKGLPQGHVPLTRILVVPIFSYDHIVAAAAVANKPSDYEQEDANQIEGFATNVQVILERRRMEESLEESEKELRFLSSQLLTAQERERKRIAGEIHDGIGQSLTTIKFGVENALRQMDKGAARGGVESLEAIIPLAQEAIEEVRRIQTDLRPPILDDLGILATIGWFCREFQAIYTGIRIETQINIQENEVPELLKIVIYRVLQEAMNNIAKHSKADLLNLCLTKTDGQLELLIQDNGQGFDVEEALALDQARRGLGLSSMRERTELSGGAFSIESARGKGTTVRAVWQQ